MDAMLMVLTQMKQGAPFAATSKIFGIGGNKFRRIFERFVKTLSKDFIDNFIAFGMMYEYCKKK